jgi:hypothetical protein
MAKYSDAQLKGLSLLRQTLNALNGAVTYSSTMVASLLLGYGDSHTSWQSTAIHPHGLYLQHLNHHQPSVHSMAEGPTADRVEVTLAIPTQESNGAWYSGLVTKVHDYLYRPHHLEDMCPILFSMMYEKKSKGCPDEQGLQDEPGKPPVLIERIH